MSVRGRLGVSEAVNLKIKIKVMQTETIQKVNILLIGGVWHFAPYNAPGNNLNIPKERFESGKRLVEFCNKHRLSVNNKDCLRFEMASKLKY